MFSFVQSIRLQFPCLTCGNSSDLNQSRRQRIFIAGSAIICMICRIYITLRLIKMESRGLDQLRPRRHWTLLNVNAVSCFVTHLRHSYNTDTGSAKHCPDRPSSRCKPGQIAFYSPSVGGGASNECPSHL